MKKLILAQQVLQEYDFDTIAFRGMSGAFLGPSIATAMEKQMILVRKPEDKTHSKMRVEGNRAANRYVIVDDFIASGDTKRAIIDAISTWAPDANFVGLLEVHDLHQIDIDRYRQRNKPFPLS
jgi:adenine/guanine phosphoribosyltransferase-like PRPP-binding protein